MRAAALSGFSTMQPRSDKSRAKDLRTLLAGSRANAAADIAITDLTLDSRNVQPGGAFIALPGTRTHGIGFAAQAVSAGAKVILWEPTPGVAAPRVPASVLLLAVPELTSFVGAMADRFFDAPSQTVRVVGVTGTNGKTTTAHVIASASQLLGTSAAYAGTIGFGRIDALKTVTHTTPDAITVHRQLAELRDGGVRCLAMEVSSHALDQHRVDGVRFDTAVFTNLTRDHLDYHGTFESYGAAKAKLFAWPGLKHAVINADDEFGRQLLAPSQLSAASGGGAVWGHAAMLTSYSRSPSLPDMRNGVRHLFSVRAVPGAAGLDITVDGSWGVATLHSRFIGAFNVENLLAALATLLGWNVPFHDALAALEQCTPPPGRMETLHATGKPLVIVDYAHTPDALEKVLSAARKHTAGKLICVFGCGGDRDPGKRPLMAAVAEQLADRVIVTDDNPRTENGDAIVADIVKGFAAPARVLIERDRAQAIAQAIALGTPDDIVVIAGKGHEDYQIVGSERRRFSDREVARAELEQRS
jgi:UDP-N-acetylmuramoyl-L-alanyl-D-glutamate--2,6-diaminopimelate ligase